MVFRPPRVVCAPDKFKGSLSAGRVAAALAAGLCKAIPGAVVETVPIADGGEGTVEAALSVGMREVAIEVQGPTGAPVRCRIALQPPLAVIELADACGLMRLLDGRLQPLEAHTTGLGQAIAAALDAGAEEVVIGVGGSASTDVGLGALVGLGGRLLDRDGRDVPPGGRHLSRVAAIDLSGLHPRVASARFHVATDVDNPLTGPNGTVAVFGPQKGVTPDIAAALEAGVAHAGSVLESATGRPIDGGAGIGAAGGVPAALVSALGADIVSGADYVLDLLGLETRVTGVDLVITGEGTFDDQTLRGKGPAAVLAAARRHGATAVVVAGRLAIPDDVLHCLGVRRSWSLLERAASPQDAMHRAAELLVEVGTEVGGWLTCEIVP